MSTTSDPPPRAIAAGVDIVLIPRIAKLIATPGQRFLDKVFTSAEQATCSGSAERLAARWAAKEATIKALGLRIADVDLRNIEVLSTPDSAPALALHGEVADAARELGASRMSLSLSHDGDYAIAFVVITQG